MADRKGAYLVLFFKATQGRVDVFGMSILVRYAQSATPHFYVFSSKLGQTPI